ncbi:ankyrin repeats (3 copies) domain-containing protein [Cordyceps javanica]|nr:ankyrin repeats (3 copies) domain-containing protein [Cordyceps javanica]
MAPEYKLDVNRVFGSDDSTALITVGRRNWWDVFDLLVRSGADVNVCPKRKHRLLSYIVREGNSKSVERVVAARADVNLSDNHGKAAIHLYDLMVWRQKKSVVVQLLQAGADVNARVGPLYFLIFDRYENCSIFELAIILAADGDSFCFDLIEEHSRIVSDEAVHVATKFIHTNMGERPSLVDVQREVGFLQSVAKQ